MTIEQITEKQAQQSIKFEAAKAIREILEKARKDYGSDEWDGDDIESEVLELVTAEE